MKTHTTHFTSTRSALVLGLGLFASVSLAGVTLANSLLIPTTLDNAVITIKKIFLSTDGVAIDANQNVKISLDGSNGNINSKGAL